MGSPDSDYPKDPNLQLLVGVIFAESGSKNYGGGENASEKEAIGKTFVNAAYYAAMKEQGGKKCYNDSFGDGTILSAIQTMAVAYSTATWNRVMNGNGKKVSLGAGPGGRPICLWRLCDITVQKHAPPHRAQGLP